MQVTDSGATNPFRERAEGEGDAGAEGRSMRGRKRKQGDGAASTLEAGEQGEGQAEKNSGARHKRAK